MSSCGLSQARSNLEPPRFENAKERLIAGPSVSYTFETRSGIPEQWHRFAPQIGKVPGQIGNSTYGVAWNYKPGVGFDYLCGVEVGNAGGLPQDFSQVASPPGGTPCSTTANTSRRSPRRWMRSGKNGSPTRACKRPTRLASTLHGGIQSANRHGRNGDSDRAQSVKPIPARYGVRVPFLKSPDERNSDGNQNFRQYAGQGPRQIDGLFSGTRIPVRSADHGQNGRVSGDQRRHLCPCS